MKNNHQVISKLSPVADTVSGAKARENPKDTIAHYEHFATHLWLPPKVSEVADTILDAVREGRTAWGSLSGPYGFGKTAAAISLWSYARKKGFLAIPPLSCTNFDELAHGIAALSIAQVPKAEKKIHRLFKEIWTEGLDSMIHNDAERYQMTPKKLRQLFQDKLNMGQFTLDSRCHRLVEFLAKLGELVTEWSNGLLVILDELQQLLGPLDARAIINFREFVWGMRTERSHCGVIIVLDSLLEARLARWATDILHRIREHGPSLQLSLVYTREFPRWLWENLTSSNGSGPFFADAALTSDVLISLGQFVERTDISNGPRTVVDVFGRAAEYYGNTGMSYDIPNLVEDIHQGRFRYFGEGATLQTVLTQLLTDEYVLEDQTRATIVQTLAAFPMGCPPNTLNRFIPHEEKLKIAKAELFRSLLVELSDGLALESLQQVRRLRTDWEQILARCWETLPALDALAVHMPDILRRVMVPRLFPKGNPANPQWELLADQSRLALSGWDILKGTFDESYPQREVALCVSHEAPETWPRDVDLCVVLLCDSQLEKEVEPSADLIEKDGVAGIVIKLPVMKPLEQHLPAELDRYRKYVQPEPLRPSTILSAVHDLEVFLVDLGSKEDVSDAHNPIEEAAKIRRAKAFVIIALDFIAREIIQGAVDIGSGRPIHLRGPELLHALFAAVCRRRFPEYQTLVKTPTWREVIGTYRSGLRSSCLSSAIRQGREALKMTKAEIMKVLFGQSSTAAGDSLLRVLGPLTETSGTPQEFTIRLPLHPAEVLLLNYLKSLKGAKSVPAEAGKQFLRHNGYIEAEAEEVIRLLADRELLVTDNSNNLKVVKSADAARDALLEKIATAGRQLKRLAGEASDTPPSTDSIKELQAYANMLDGHLAARVEEQFQELTKIANSLRTMIGAVLATNVEADWATTNMSIHFIGIATLLRKTKEDLLKSLRKELKRIEGVNDKANHTNIEWAVGWRRKRDSFFKFEEKLRDRVEQFTARVAALNLWVPQSDQLRSTGILCEKVRATDPGPIKTLNRLISDYRERFSVDAWSGLDAVNEFARRLQSVQSEVQGLLFRQMQAFNQELEILKQEYSPLLPSTSSPAFDIPLNYDADYIEIQEIFQRLYVWALTGFKDVIADCRQRKGKGLQWRDISSAHISWKDIDLQVEKILQLESCTVDFDEIRRIGDKILRMLNGFNDSIGKPIDNALQAVVYNNPLEPPDFEELKNLFARGEVLIRVEPRTVIAEITKFKQEKI